jgi:hypothetical protein
MPTIDEITVADDPERWSELGFDVHEGICALAGVELRLTGAGAGEGITGWTLRDLTGTDLDGLPTAISTRPARAPALSHANGAVSIDHVVAVSPALGRSVERLVAAGMDLRRIREEPTPAGAPRQAFFRLGREILEMVQEPEEVVATEGGPNRPLRFWGLALLVDDLDATVARMAPHASEPRAAVQQGRRIATLRRSARLAIPLALMTRERDAAQPASTDRDGTPSRIFKGAG